MTVSGYNAAMETESLIVTKTTVAGMARAAWLRTLAAIRALPEAKGHG